MTKTLILALLMTCVSCATHVVLPPTSVGDLPPDEKHVLDMVRWWVGSPEAAAVVADALVELPLSVSEPRAEPKWGGVAAEDADGARYTVTWSVMEATLIVLTAREAGARLGIHEHVVERLRLAAASHPEPDYPELPADLNIQPNGIEYP